MKWAGFFDSYKSLRLSEEETENFSGLYNKEFESLIQNLSMIKQWEIVFSEQIDKNQNIW